MTENNGDIVCTGTIDETARTILEPFGRLVFAPDGREASLLPLMRRAVALVVRGDGVATAPMIDAAPSLKVIGRSGAGVDTVDIAAATARGIPVVYTPGANARSVAEASMAMVLALCKQALYWDRRLKAGDWACRNTFCSEELDRETLGIVGFGAIGQNVAKLAAGFDMTVLACDPYASTDAAARLGVELIDIDQLVQRCKFICLHASLTDQTRHLINRDRLQRFRRGSYLVNLARGDLIEDLDCLDGALEAGILAGVGLDVFAPEPPDVTHPIFKRDNCLTAPHAIGLSTQAIARIFEWMAKDMAAVLSGQRPKHVVNAQVFDAG